MEIILASGSPRRHELLLNAGIKHTVLTTDADETLPEGIAPQDAVMLLAERKAMAALASGKVPENSVLLAADTVVYFDNKILGKPKDAADAKEMLKMLENATNIVYTGMYVTNGTKSYKLYDATEVTMRRIKEKEIDEYIALGEPFGKAGGYAVQGYGSRFIKSVNGDYTTVVGLPVCYAYQLLKDLGGDC